VTLDDILHNPPKPHVQGGKNVSMGLTSAVLRFIHSNVGGSSATLETGCGLSTVVFALTGARHIVIAPGADELDYLTRYCAERGISTERVTFIAGSSQTVLPDLSKPPLDLVLIDGCHGFPAPYIDWFYTAAALKIGGYVIVDDTWLWSCQVLRDFLHAQPQWRLVGEYNDRTAIFQKLEDGAEWLEWTKQPLVASRGRKTLIGGQVRYRPPSSIDRVLADVRRGDFKSLGRKLARQLSRFSRSS
jgi:predicted O-methyltransferase YrrM